MPFFGKKEFVCYSYKIKEQIDLKEHIEELETELAKYKKK